MEKLFRIGVSFAILLCLAACGIKPVEQTEPSSTEPTSEEITSTAIASVDDTTAQTDIPAVAPPVTGAPPATATTGPVSPKTKPPESSQPAPPPTVPEVVAVVIPEGFTFYQVARRLEANGVCTAADFTAAAQTYQIQSFYAPISPRSCYRMEGMLFPDTYEFYVGEDPTAVLRKFLNNYAEKSGLPDYDTLILASIIERETRSDSHMAMVSSVFHNRLDQGIKLQADATIAYVEEHIKKDPLVKDPGQYADRYNTYKCPALPVGPICSPGLRAIEAAKNPSTSDYLYYFFGKDETNHYTYTYDEHLAAIKIYGIG